MSLNIPEKEEFILLNQLRERLENRKKKYSHLLYKLVDPRFKLGVSYEEISDWLKSHQIQLSVDNIKANIWYYKNKVLSKNDSTAKNNKERSSNPPENVSPEFDFEKRKRELIEEARNKNSGLDKIRRL